MSTLGKILSSIPELKKIRGKEEIEYSDEIGLLKQKVGDLLDLRNEYADILSTEKTLSVEVEELKNRLFPSIYFGTAKHHTTKEPFIIARSMWKKGISDYAQLSAYIGPLAKYEKGIKDPEVKKIALEKIRQLIRRKFPIKA